MKISSLMKANPIVINPAITLEEAAQKMREIGTGVFPVGKAGEAEGMLTDRDIVMRAVASDKLPSATYVYEVMTTDVVSCTKDCTAKKAFQLMQENDIGRLLVVDDENQIIGIVSMADLISNASNDVWDTVESTEKNHHSNTIKKAG